MRYRPPAHDPMHDTEPLLSVDDLVVSYDTDDGALRALDGVSLRVAKGQRVGLVGESGCGKSTVALSILRLLPSPGARVLRGAIRFDGQDLLTLPERSMRAVRGRRVSMVFQEPMTSLNPVCTIGAQVIEALTIHHRLSRREARARAAEMLDRVGLPNARRQLDAWPHQLSGGMRQRVMIAIALICNPELLIADEPTTALDVTTQAQILELLGHLQHQLGMAALLITHDLAVLAEFAQTVLVMYAGQVVEQSPVDLLFSSPAHPYSRALLESIPSCAAPRGSRLPAIPGRVPDLRRLPLGCRFQDRCPVVVEDCRTGEIPLRPLGDGRSARCILSPREAP